MTDQTREGVWGIVAPPDRQTIVEQCACGARLEFLPRLRQTFSEQDAADQAFLSAFRKEHACRYREQENTP